MKLLGSIYFNNFDNGACGYFCQQVCNCKFGSNEFPRTCLFDACGNCNLGTFCLIYCIICGIIHFNDGFGLSKRERQFLGISLRWVMENATHFGSQPQFKYGASC